MSNTDIDINMDINVVEKVLSAIEDVCKKHRDEIVRDMKLTGKWKEPITDDRVFSVCIYFPIALLEDIVTCRDKDCAPLFRIEIEATINEFVEAIENAIRDFSNNKTAEYIGNVVGIFETFIDMIINAKYNNLVKSDIARTAIEKYDEVNK